MDDILISSNDKLKLVEVTMQLLDYFSKSHWTSNAGKEVIASESITAFNIDLIQNHRSVNEEKLKQFELDFYQAINLSKRKGIYSYVKTVNADQLGGFQ